MAILYVFTILSRGNNAFFLILLQKSFCFLTKSGACGINMPFLLILGVWIYM